ncbi:MAG: hypothetical protein IPM36_01195 [Lewinellaceae bacterium]|nr:hypothetical protein [Lewinellaceae bacterium]
MPDLLRRYVANNHQTVKKIAGKGFNAVAPEGEEMPRQRRNLAEKTKKEKKFIALNSVPMKTENKCN